MGDNQCAYTIYNKKCYFLLTCHKPLQVSNKQILTQYTQHNTQERFLNRKSQKKIDFQYLSSNQLSNWTKITIFLFQLQMKKNCCNIYTLLASWNYLTVHNLYHQKNICISNLVFKQQYVEFDPNFYSPSNYKSLNCQVNTKLNQQKNTEPKKKRVKVRYYMTHNTNIRKLNVPILTCFSCQLYKIQQTYNQNTNIFGISNISLKFYNMLIIFGAPNIEFQHQVTNIHNLYYFAYLQFILLCIFIVLLYTVYNAKL
eukprot:TRINITY_DN7563_c0_g1_i1.p1 TRINITY_DN7563_c0_g1~~TRINITY_DN7563_c0_g1_i1.p1  ORF type:complete len:256 (+),score=-25.20 TRINITY_DN7563_c0_g1_i1:359-1126(+)